jgi:hypothetical protein
MKFARSSRERCSVDSVQHRTPKADELVVALWIRAVAMATAQQRNKQVEDNVVDLFKLAEPPYRAAIRA